MANVQTGKSSGPSRDNNLISRSEKNVLTNYDRLTLDQAKRNQQDDAGPVPWPTGAEEPYSGPTLVAGMVFWLPQRGGGSSANITISVQRPDNNFGEVGDLWIEVLPF